MIFRLVLTFRLKVRSTNLNSRAPRACKASSSARKRSSGNGQAVLSSEDRQNSHLNGQPREASTYNVRWAMSSSLYSAYGSAICSSGGCTPAWIFISGFGPCRICRHSCGKVRSPQPVTR